MAKPERNQKWKGRAGSCGSEGRGLAGVVAMG